MPLVKLKSLGTKFEYQLVRKKTSIATVSSYIPKNVRDLTETPHFLQTFWKVVKVSKHCGIILSPKQEIIKIVNTIFVLGTKLCIPMQCGWTFGIEFDTVAMELRLPLEKLTELRQRIKLLLGSTLREIQSIIGLLNFACQVVDPGRGFCRRLIDVTCKVKKSWRKVRISVGMKKDLQVWLNLRLSY
jgi:hypothetical protein